MKGAYVLNSPMIHYEKGTSIEKGGQRDSTEDYYIFNKLDLEYKKLSFVEELSKWKPQFNIILDNNNFLKYKNILLGQTPNIQNEFKKILSVFNTIIEIGFHRGGLSLWLNDNKLNNTKLICYDITNEFLQVDKSENIDFRIKNCYLEENILEIKNEINRDGKTLVLCDGGDKNFEFITFSKFLKNGDVIMCHDYCETINEYLKIQNDINWNTNAKSFYDDIKKSISDNKLIPYNYTNFKNVLWGSFIKSDYNIDLSILICTLDERKDTFLARLKDKLEPQIKNKNVEMIILSDNAEISIGSKRNKNRWLSSGQGSPKFG
jgi:23S rRNA U2552 (ribose-2'-O)-methylase RlmE/FtsJ